MSNVYSDDEGVYSIPDKMPKPDKNTKPAPAPPPRPITAVPTSRLYPLFTVMLLAELVIIGGLSGSLFIFVFMGVQGNCNCTSQEQTIASPAPTNSPSTAQGFVWKPIQRRVSGDVDFFRGWKEYEKGFGDKDGSFWIGLLKMNFMTREPRKLQIRMQKWNDKKIYKAVWNNFKVGSAEESYKLYVGGFSIRESNVGDSLAYHNGQKFSTKDRDNDKHAENCTQNYYGAFWYNACHHSNLNGAYYNYPLALRTQNSADGINYKSLTGYRYSLKFVEMSILLPRNSGDTCL